MNIPVKLSINEINELFRETWKLRLDNGLRLGQAFVYLYSKKYSSEIVFFELFNTDESGQLTGLVMKHIWNGS